MEELMKASIGFIGLLTFFITTVIYFTYRFWKAIFIKEEYHIIIINKELEKDNNLEKNKTINQAEKQENKEPVTMTKSFIIFFIVIWILIISIIIKTKYYN